MTWTVERMFPAFALPSASSRSVVCRVASRTAGPSATDVVDTHGVFLRPSRRTTFLALSSALIAELLDGNSYAEVAAASSTELDVTDTSRQVYLDISADRNPLGRVIIELYDDVPIGAQRFADLAIGKEGVRYQATRFIRLTDRYVVNGGVSALSFIETADSPITGGDSLQDLEKEMDEKRHVHDAKGVVSLIIKDPNVRPPKKKLVTVKGKFETVEEGGGKGPNGTGFAITTGAAPELDATNLVIGRVIEGMDVVTQMCTFPTVKDNRSSLFFKAAKAIGDPRADIAEMGFGRPFSRIVVSSGGAVAS